MNKTEFVKAVAEKACLTRAQAENAYCAALEVIEETLKAGDKVALVGFGTFELKTRAAHKGVDPRTKAKINVPASKAPVLKIGKAYKELFN